MSICPQTEFNVILVERLRYRQTEEYHEIPAERRFNGQQLISIQNLNAVPGLEMTCEQRQYYGDISSVLAACIEVQRRCAPSSVQAEQISLPYGAIMSFFLVWVIFLVGPDCQFDENMNYYGSDYNNGFVELKLTPADCCRRCMQDRGCHAWTRTFSGQCWLKWEVPNQNQWRTVPGDVSGIRTRKTMPLALLIRITLFADFNATCGPTFTGFFIDAFRDEEKRIPENPVETPEQCCQECINVNCK